MWKIALQFDAGAETIRVARKLVAYLARLGNAPPPAVADIELAAGEVLGNALRHAYGGRPGPLEVEVSLTDKWLEILIHDHGEPIARAPSIPASPQQGPGGLGLYLVGRVMDEAEIIHPYRSNRGTGVRLKKHLG